MSLYTLAKEHMSSDWFCELDSELSSPYIDELNLFLRSEHKTARILPEPNDIFNCFKYTPFDKLSVVLLGQDPYPNPEYAHGLCFSVKKDITNYPQSLKNMFIELKSDLGVSRSSGNLQGWAEQGMLLLNTTMTVRSGQSLSHAKKGWERFTDYVIEDISRKKEKIVFVLLGGNAKSKLKLIDQSKHYVVSAVHPSPLSAYNGFFGSKIFSRINEYISEAGGKVIDFAY